MASNGLKFRARDVEDQLYDIRQRRIVGPFLIGGLIQALLVGMICNQYWTLVTRSNSHMSRRLHLFLVALVVLNVTNDCVTFAVSARTYDIHVKEAYTSTPANMAPDCRLSFPPAARLHLP